MKPAAAFRTFLALASSAPLCISHAHAVPHTLYWDVNGTSSGFNTVAGTWNMTNNFWNTDSGGGSGTQTINIGSTGISRSAAPNNP